MLKTGIVKRNEIYYRLWTKDEILSALKGFVKGLDDHTCYLFYAIARKKDNPQLKTNKEEIMIREVIYHTTELDFMLNKMLKLIELYDSDLIFRFYVSINKRSLSLARKELMINMLEHKDIIPSKEWKSVLAHKKNAVEKNILIDCDDEQSVFLNMRAYLGLIQQTQWINVQVQVNTPNGGHIVTSGFDTRDFMNKFAKNKFEIHKDAYVLMGVVKNESE